MFIAPFKDIVVDVDGSLSGNGLPMSTIVRYGKHMDPSECNASPKQIELLDGVICAPTT